MENEFAYMLCVVGAGFAVTFAMRALPFLLFAGRGRDLPRWAGRLCAAVSPLVISALIVYSYSGLMWRTPWPYLAGVTTVGVHLWKNNPLASIAAGTALYMCLVSCGCMTQDRDIEYGAARPLIRITTHGMKFRDRYVTPEEAVHLLEKNRIPHDRTIHILVDDDYRDTRAPWVFQRNFLARAGYTRSILVSSKKADALSEHERGNPRGRR